MSTQTTALFHFESDLRLSIYLLLAGLSQISDQSKIEMMMVVVLHIKYLVLLLSHVPLCMRSSENKQQFSTHGGHFLAYLDSSKRFILLILWYSIVFCRA